MINKYYKLCYMETSSLKKYIKCLDKLENSLTNTAICRITKQEFVKELKKKYRVKKISEQLYQITKNYS
jgi:predicted nucleic acid-binding protein